MKKICRFVLVHGTMGKSTANVSGKGLQPLIGTPLPDLAQVVSPFELRAINDPARAVCVIDRFVTDKRTRTNREAVVHSAFYLICSDNDQVAPLANSLMVRS